MCATPTTPGVPALGDRLVWDPTRTIPLHALEVGMSGTPVNSLVSGGGVEWPEAPPSSGVHTARARLSLARAVREALDADWSPPVQAPPERRTRSEQSEGVYVP
jgi:hypothetical protein